MLSWLANIQNTQPVAHAVIILSLVAAIGLALGSIRVRGFSLCIAGTLFAGLIFAHFGYNLEPSFRSFIQEFGLILFVYTIGLQVGPGFLDSLRRQGLALNLLAAGNVLLGVAVTGGLDLTRDHDLVLATGGGAVLREDNRAVLKERGTVVYLRADLDTLVERTRRDRNRPLLQTADPRGKIEELLRAREPIYLELADIVVDTGERAPASVARDILTRLKQVAHDPDPEG